METGAGGIRAEALSGFNTVFSVGLPSLSQALAYGLDENSSLVYTLLRIILSTEDSNLVHRGGLEGMNFAKEVCQNLTKEGPAALDLNKVRKADCSFIKKNLSPGGSADLLAMTIFINLLTEKREILMK